MRKKRWSPYVVGAGIGVLSWFAFLSADRPIGVSTAISKAAGMLASLVAPAQIGRNPYFTKFRPALDWEFMLVIGLALGAYLSSRLSGDKPPAEAGPLPWKRYLLAFCGGAVLIFGARLAGGCTSGHGISGSLQLAVSGWLFFGAVFASGLATAFLLFGKGGARG